MLNKINDSVSFQGVKYTSAGKAFVQKQSQEVRSTLEAAEKKMKNFKKANLIVNKNGYAIQTREDDGIHCYKIKNILFTCYDRVKYYVGDGSKILKFEQPKSSEFIENCTLFAAEDARKNNKFLGSIIFLIENLEKTQIKPIKENFFTMAKEKIKSMF